jgi:hypothetical protein
MSGACEKFCAFACRRGRSQWGCEQAVVVEDGKGREPEQGLCAHPPYFEGVHRGERAAGIP